MAQRAGQVPKASDIVGLYEGSGSATITLTNAAQDVTGTVVTYFTNKPMQWVKFTATFDFRITTAGTGYCHGRIVLDGVLDGRQCVFVVQTVESRHAGGFVMTKQIPFAGGHTAKLQTYKDAGGGVGIVETGACTSLIVEVFP